MKETVLASAEIAAIGALGPAERVELLADILSTRWSLDFRRSTAMSWSIVVLAAVFCPRSRRSARDKAAFLADRSAASLGAAMAATRPFQHVGLVIIVLDQGERVQAYLGLTLSNSMNSPPRMSGDFLVGAADVDHPDLGAGGQIGVDKIVGEEALAGSRLRGNHGVVVGRGCRTDRCP